MSKFSKYGSITGLLFTSLFFLASYFARLEQVLGTWLQIPYIIQFFLFGACCAWAALAWAEDIIRNWKREWPDFEEWDEKESFRLWEAAALWVDETPRRPPGRRERKQFRVFSNAITERKLEVLRQSLEETIQDAIDETEGNIVKSNPEWIVSRDDLIRFAKAKHEKPRFLFPKERI